MRTRLAAVLALFGAACLLMAARRPSPAGQAEPTAHLHTGRSRVLLDPTAAPPVTGKFTSLTIPLDLCGFKTKAPNAAGQVLGTKWNDTSSSPSLPFVRSLKTFLEQCSYGALTLNNDPNENRVLSKLVPIRSAKVCQATGPVCDGHVDAIADEAELYVKNVLKVDVTKYSVKILLFPRDAGACSNTNFGRVACFSNTTGPQIPEQICRTWTTSLEPLELANLVSFNLGAMQAGVPNDAIGGDWSSPMNAAGYFCHNAYHAHMLGWSKPGRVLDTKTTAAGNWTAVTLVPRATTANNYLLLSGAATDVYVSYTAPVGWEQDVSPYPEVRTKAANKVLVHTKRSAKDNLRSVLLGALDKNATLATSTSYPRWLVAHVAGDIKGAQVQVCLETKAGQCKAPEPKKNSTPTTHRRRKPPSPSKKKPAPPKKKPSPPKKKPSPKKPTRTNKTRRAPPTRTRLFN